MLPDWLPEWSGMDGIALLLSPAQAGSHGRHTL